VPAAAMASPAAMAPGSGAAPTEAALEQPHAFSRSQSCPDPAPSGENKDDPFRPPLREISKMSELSGQIQRASRVFQVSTTVRAGGAMLALCAGAVNAIAYKRLGRFVSHATGTLTKVGLGLQDSAVADSGDSALLVLSFLCGSLVCGLLIGKNTIHFGMALYDFCLLGVASLLVATVLLADHTCARYLAASACGLQNGMATIWGGAVIRTTHVTGLVTDVGLLLGRLLSMLMRKRCGKAFDAVDMVEAADDLSKLSVLLTLGPAFLLGALVGAYLEHSFGEYAFLFPAGTTGSAGVAYSMYRVFVLHQRFFSDEEMEGVDVPSDLIEDVGAIEKANSAPSLFGVHVPEGRGSRTSVNNEALIFLRTHYRQCGPVVTVRRQALFPAYSSEAEAEAEHGAQVQAASRERAATV